MADHLSKEKRSWNMSRIGSKNTKPELIVRSFLHGIGMRFRLHSNKLPCKPDIILPKYQTVVFVHGCFWHQHGCKNSTIPKTNKKFWVEKFQKNKNRDKKNKDELIKLNWKVLVIWECEINKKELETLVTNIKDNC